MSAPVDVRGVIQAAALKAVWERDEANANGDEGRGEQWERLRASLREVDAAVADLVEAAGKAQDTNRDDYVLGRPDMSHLPEAERAAFLRGWDAASEAVFRTGLRAALARTHGEGA